jgi:fructokinase
MIVSCGEALIDFLAVPAGAGLPRYEPHPGGSPFNVAIALGRLGAPAAFLGGLSTDYFGEALLSALKESGVDTSLALVVPRPTTLAFVTLAGGEARYAFFDENSAGRLLADSDMPAIPASVNALHFGSFSLVEEPCGSAFEMLMQREMAHHVISLDLNIRPALIHNRDGYLARVERMAAMSDIVKLSAGDLAWLAPEMPFAALAEHWLKHGTHVAILTDGANGARAITARGDLSVPAAPATVVDTIGGGDAFTAALLAALHERELLTKEHVARLPLEAVEAAMRFAARAAALTVARAGASPPWRADLG